MYDVNKTLLPIEPVIYNKRRDDGLNTEEPTTNSEVIKTKPKM